MLDRLRSLAVFAKVADLGSFRAAARALALSPSVISHHVRELESRLVTPLLHRTTRRLSLTAAGEHLLISARQMVEAAERGLDEATSGGGRLRVTAPAFLVAAGLCGDLAEFAAQHPGAELVASFSEITLDLIRDGFDVALRFGRLADSSFMSRKLGDMRRVLVASPRLLAGHRLRTPRDLEACAFIQLSSRPPQLSLSSAGRRPVTVAVRARISVDSAVAMRELARAGAGIAAVPEVLVRDDLARGHLAIALPKWMPASIGVYAVWPHHAQRFQLAQAFVAFIQPRVVALLDGHRRG